MNKGYIIKDLNASAAMDMYLRYSSGNYYQFVQGISAQIFDTKAEAKEVISKLLEDMGHNRYLIEEVYLVK